MPLTLIMTLTSYVIHIWLHIWPHIWPHMWPHMWPHIWPHIWPLFPVLHDLSSEEVTDGNCVDEEGYDLGLIFDLMHDPDLIFDLYLQSWMTLAARRWPMATAWTKRGMSWTAEARPTTIQMTMIPGSVRITYPITQNITMNSYWPKPHPDEISMRSWWCFVQYEKRCLSFSKDEIVITYMYW